MKTRKRQRNKSQFRFSFLSLSSLSVCVRVRVCLLFSRFRPIGERRVVVHALPSSEHRLLVDEGSSRSGKCDS